MKNYFLLLCGLVLLGCEKDSIVISELERLDGFRALWYDQNIFDYEITQQISCFCPREYTVPKLMRIENNRLVAVNGGPFIEAYPTDFLTIDEAFDFIEDRLLENPDEARIFYDGTFGFPYSIYFDMDFTIADEEINYSFSDFYYLE